MKIRLSLAYVLLSAGLLCCRSDDSDGTSEPLAVIETAIPNGLVPGSAITLKGKNFQTVQYVQFANSSVPANQFLRTGSNEITLKVPTSTQAGDVRIANENGLGQAKNLGLITSNSGLTTTNVSTSVNDITLRTYSNECNPRYIFYCLQGTCIYLERQARILKVGSSPSNPVYCEPNFTEERIGDTVFEVFRVPAGTFKFQKATSSGYTGLVMIDLPSRGLHIGNIRKTDSYIVAFSVLTGAEITLCRPSPDAPANAFAGPPTYCQANICGRCP